jgi:hypothetical protein
LHGIFPVVVIVIVVTVTVITIAIAIVIITIIIATTTNQHHNHHHHLQVFLSRNRAPRVLPPRTRERSILPGFFAITNSQGGSLAPIESELFLLKKISFSPPQKISYPLVKDAKAPKSCTRLCVVAFSLLLLLLLFQF